MIESNPRTGPRKRREGGERETSDRSQVLCIPIYLSLTVRLSQVLFKERVPKNPCLSFGGWFHDPWRLWPEPSPQRRSGAEERETSVLCLAFHKESDILWRERLGGKERECWTNLVYHEEMTWPLHEV